MTSGTSSQLAALQRIAAFSAAVRGHQLGAWRMGEGYAAASCTHCGAELRVYFPALQPEMDGTALDDACGQHTKGGVAMQTVLFIHGVWTTPRCWRYFAPLFAEKGYLTLTPAWPLRTAPSVINWRILPPPEWDADEQALRRVQGIDVRLVPESRRIF